MKTKFASYCINGIADGCKYCVKGQKLVLFITGKCSRNCMYCSLSKKRKNKDITWANERICLNKKDLIKETVESNAKGAGITGGDPLLCLSRTINYAKALKRKFGKRFHIHIYLPTNLVTKEKLKSLFSCIDEVRFHPGFLAKKQSKEETAKDIEKIKIANKLWKKSDIGIELPLIPEKKKQILDFIIKARKHIGFVNLNELEISDTNFDFITKNYRMKQGGYVVSGSKEVGLWILKKAKQARLKLKIHLCTAETKNCHQYKNRLKMHKILPYGLKTDAGTAIYFAIYAKSCKDFSRLKKEIKAGYADRIKKRIIINEKTAKALFNKHKITRVEELPTFDGIEIEREEI